MNINKAVPQDDDIPLVRTRERRANAGNRMRELLEQELEGMNNYRRLVGDDDDDVDELDLLFQEDEGDEDFEIGEDDKPTGGRSKSVGKLTEEAKTGRAKMDLEDDMMLSSDSGESSTENGEAEDEEAFIRRQERLLKRKERTRKLAPKIVKRAGSEADVGTDATTNKRRRTKHSAAAQLDPESLLLTERRVSTRKSVIENRHKIYERLSKARAKRQLIREKLRKTRESAVQHVLTQEDRLRIAHETEVKNLQSLNRFKEQEDLKKQSRLALQQRNKLKFKPNELVETFLSTSWEVTPSSELADREYWELELEKRDKKRSKKKYGSKKGKKSTEDEHIQQETDQNGVKVKVESSSSVGGLTDGSLSNSNTPPKDADDQLPTEHGRSQGDETACRGLSNQDNIGSTSAGSLSKVVTRDTKIDSNAEEQGGRKLANEHTGDKCLALDREVVESEKQTIQSSVDNPHSSSLIHSSKKQVTFDENPQILLIDDGDDNKVTCNITPNDNTTIDEPTISDGRVEGATPALNGGDPATEIVYEGPNQLVGKNFLTRFYFMNDAVGPTSPPDEGELEYFGEKGSVTPDRQGTYEPLLRSKMTITPESIVEDEIRENIVPDLDFLSNYRAFGEYEKREKKGVIQDNKIDNSGLKITTASPVGLYTANNNVRKHCFINNKPCQYFDPNLGVPYADLDGYNIIKELLRGSSDSSYRWCGFRNGGIFLNARERPAKGVPEGF